MAITVPSPGPGVNAAPAIQAALDSGAGYPVNVYLPSAQYDVWPAAAGDVYPGKNCLEIRYSNVTLRGAGKGATTVSCKVAGGLDPNTNWETTHPSGVATVWRGNGIALKGASLSEITIRDLRLTGGSPRTLSVWGAGTAGGISFPANPATGEGWDITNKGILVGDGTARTNVTIQDAEIDSFRGELVYYGGSSGNQNLVMRRSYLHDSIASAFSCSGRLTVEDSEITTSLNAIENTPLADPQIIQRNHIHDNVHGITIASNAAAPASGSTVISGNTIERNWIWAMYVQGAVKGVDVVGNTATDHPNYGGILMGGPGVGGVGPEVTVRDNVFRLDTWDGDVKAVTANSDLGYPVNFQIFGNRAERTALAVSRGRKVIGLEVNSFEPSSVINAHDNDWTGGGAP